VELGLERGRGRGGWWGGGVEGDAGDAVGG